MSRLYLLSCEHTSVCCRVLSHVVSIQGTGTPGADANTVLMQVHRSTGDMLTGTARYGSVVARVKLVLTLLVQDMGDEVKWYHTAVGLRWLNIMQLPEQSEKRLFLGFQPCDRS